MNKYFGLLIAGFILGMIIAGCVSEYEDPYEDYIDPDVNWPTLDPNRYHWDGFTNPFYESWFYKVKDRGTGSTFFFIYGIQNPRPELDQYSGAFVYAKKDDGDFEFQLFPYSTFSASVAQCDVKVANNTATETAIAGKLISEDGDISWNLSWNILAEWVETMGAFSNIPGLPVNWYVNALNARATGTINWRGETFEVEGEPAFSDHAWGTVFPDAWLRIQANNFTDNYDALAVAGGPVAISYIEPPIFMIAFRTKERLYEFRAQDLNVIFNIDISLDDGLAKVTGTKGDQRIIVTAHVPPENLQEVYVPGYEGMIPGALQGYSGSFTVEIFQKSKGDWYLVKRTNSRTGVLDLGGNYGGYDFY